MAFIPGSSMTSGQFGVIENKLRSASKVTSAQSGLVDYERVRGLRASQFMDYGEVDYKRLSSCGLLSQQSSCSIGLQRHQDRQSVYARLLSHSGELPSQSLSGNTILSSVALCEVLPQYFKAASLSTCRIGLLSVHYSAAYGSVFTCCRDAFCCVHFKGRPASPVRGGTSFPLCSGCSRASSQYHQYFVRPCVLCEGIFVDSPWHNMLGCVL